LSFPGQNHDSESGFAYNYFRDYDPLTGRYIESDPIGLAGGVNTYAYVGEGPLNANG
jgi:RHS repeat-associated protein